MVIEPPSCVVYLTGAFHGAELRSDKVCYLFNVGLVQKSLRSFMVRLLKFIMYFAFIDHLTLDVTFLLETLDPNLNLTKFIA